MSKITILGSGTCNLNPERNAAGVLIQRQGKNFVYDFGRGTAIQLVKLGLKQDDINTVILSHYHPDHVSDLLPFLQAASWSQIDKRVQPLTIYGQPSIKDFMSKFYAPFGEGHLSRGFKVNLQDLKPGAMSIDDLEFSFTDLHHSYGISFTENGKKYAIMADSDYHPDLVNALKNADIGIFDSGHITDDEIVKTAVNSHAKKLICSHQYRELDETELNIAAKKQGYQGQLIVAHDLMEFSV